MATRQTDDRGRQAGSDSHKSGLTESQSAYHVALEHRTPRPSTPGTHRQMKNTPNDDRAADRSNPPSGRNDDDTHALRAGRPGPSQRKSMDEREPSTRDAGSDDSRSGSESGKH